MTEKVIGVANANLANQITTAEIDSIQDDVQLAVANLLTALRIDTENDHNTKDTAKRVAKMYVREVFKGRYEPPPTLTEFPNVSNLDDVYTLGPITVRSACSHHLVPIVGKLWVGVLPSEKVIGISKFVRLAEWVMARPQIQEEAVMMLADELERLLNPRGVAIIMEAQHLCMTWRGVRESATVMTSSVVRGAFRDDATLRAELMQLLQAKNR